MKHPNLLSILSGSLVGVLALASSISTGLSFANPADAAVNDSSTMGSAIQLNADHQVYDAAHSKYRLNGHVVVRYKDYTITTNEAAIDVDQNGQPHVANFFNRPHVRHVIAAAKAKALGHAGTEDNVYGDRVKIYIKDNRFGAEGNVESYITTVAADPFTIRSDVQEIDNARKIVTANGKVNVLYQGNTAHSTSALLRLSEGGKADRVTFTGNAVLHKDTSEISGERITLEMGSGNLYAENGVRTRVDLKEQNNGPDKVLIYSDYQNYDKAANKMIASGHVKILYGDYVATGPKATFNIVGGTVDRIFLTGRSTIVEKAKKVTADKITITTNPKNFDAVGNVKTQFEQAPQSAAKPTAKKPTTTLNAKPSGRPATKTGGPNLHQDNELDYQ